PGRPTTAPTSTWAASAPTGSRGVTSTTVRSPACSTRRAPRSPAPAARRSGEGRPEGAPTSGRGGAAARRSCSTPRRSPGVFDGRAPDSCSAGTADQGRPGRRRQRRYPPPADTASRSPTIRATAPRSLPPESPERLPAAEFESPDSDGGAPGTRALEVSDVVVDDRTTVELVASGLVVVVVLLVARVVVVLDDDRAVTDVVED